MAAPTDSLEDLVAFSREKIEKGSKSFAVAARFFAPETRASAYMLYAWCRHCDDVIDGQALGFNAAGTNAPAGEDALTAVAELEDKTRRACAGEADEPVFAALRAVCAKHAIPERYPLDLIAGFRMDAEAQPYRTIDDTLLYSYHVAGVVGVMMAQVMGARERAVLERACDLGIAFQLTNIARDIVADHAVGRIYLPEEWLREAGLSQANLADRANRKALAGVAVRLLDTAEPYYRSARVGLAHLPLRSAWAVATALNVYRAIGTAVRNRGEAAWDSRTSTSSMVKFGGVGAGLAGAVGARLPGLAPPDHDRAGLWTMAE